MSTQLSRAVRYTQYLKIIRISDPSNNILLPLQCAEKKCLQLDATISQRNPPVTQMQTTRIQSSLHVHY